VRTSGEADVCKVCREPIKPGALKCTHCGSRQDWQRHLVFSSTVLALLIALISVLQSAIPQFIRIWEGDRSEVSLGLLQADKLSLFVIASNGGVMPGSIGAGFLNVKSVGGGVYPFPLTSDRGAGSIGPGATQEFVFTLDDGHVDELVRLVEEIDPLEPQTGGLQLVRFGPVSAQAEVGVIQFGGERESFAWPVFVTCIGRDSSYCELSDRRHDF